MPTFEITVTNIGATIVRRYHIDAEDGEEAKAIYAEGSEECVDEEVFDGDDDDIDSWNVRELK